MINTIYTIGYSGFRIEDFIATLKKNDISILIDVRSLPFSHYFTDYNKSNLEMTLRRNNIHYENYVREFGARQEDRSFYPDGYLDFELFTKSDAFLSGVEKVENLMQRDHNIVLMCSEKDPATCHRAIMVSRQFHEKGHEVVHLIPDNRKISQKDIEARLLDKFHPERDQFSLFDEPQSDAELIRDSYRKQNAIIGYSIDQGDNK